MSLRQLEVEGHAAVRFSTALSLAVSARGLSLGRLRVLLAEAGADVTVATLSRWQSGKSRPSGPTSEQVVLLLELVLGLPAGSLVELLPAPSRRGPRPVRRSVVFPQFTDQGEDWPVTSRAVRYRVWHETVTLDTDGCLVDIAEGSTVTAVEDDVRRLSFAFHDDVEQAAGMVAEATDGCTIGRVRDDLENNARHWEVVLDEPLARGESTTYAWRYGPVTPHFLDEHMVILSHPVSVLTIELVHPGSGPLQVSQISQSRDCEPATVVQGVQPMANGRSLVVLHDPPLGGHGLRWSALGR